MTNGEKYKTVEERVKEFKKFCREKNCEGCPCRDTVRDYNSPARCILVWLDLEYTEKKPELKPCPFCGCDKVKVNSVFEGSPYYVFCTKCNARASIFHTIETAVAAWNMREND